MLKSLATQSFKAPLVIIFFIPAFYFVLVFNQYIYNSPAYHNLHYLYMVLVALAFVGLCLQNQMRASYVQINLTDFLFLLFILCAILSRYTNRLSMANEGLLSLLSLAMFYPIARASIDIPRIKVIYLFLAGSYFLEFFLFVHQLNLYSGITIGKTFSFTTGTLGNSGLLAAYIIAVSPAVYFTISCLKNTKLKMLLGAVVSCLSLFVIFISQSRSALIMFLFLVLMFFWKIRPTISGKKIPVSRMYVFLFPLLCCILLFLSVFIFKTNSALGRIVIFKVILNQLSSISFFGIGYGEFPTVYNTWQMAYFSERGWSGPDAQLADISNNCFNELLQIFIEIGCIGATVFFGLILSVFKSVSKNSERFMAFCILVCILIFSLFSYPFHSSPILLLFFLALAILASTNQSPRCIVSHHLSFLVRALIIFLGIAGLYYAVEKNRSMLAWKRAKEAARPSDRLQEYRRAYPFLIENGLFLADYAAALQSAKSNKLALGILEKSKTLTPRMETYYAIADLYELTGDTKNAELVLLEAASMVPSRLKPKLLLLKFYLRQKDSVSAGSIALRALDVPVKIVSPEADFIRKSMKSALYHLNKRD